MGNVRQATLSFVWLILTYCRSSSLSVSPSSSASKRHSPSSRALKRSRAPLPLPLESCSFYANGHLSVSLSNSTVSSFCSVIFWSQSASLRVIYLSSDRIFNRLWLHWRGREGMPSCLFEVSVLNSGFPFHEVYRFFEIRRF